MRLKSLFVTKKYLITLVINIILIVFIGISFSSIINNSIYNLLTWSNTTSAYVAYDHREFAKNTYVYYGKNIFFTLEKGDSIKIDADIYQFIDNKVYDDRTLLNRKNIVSGSYMELKGNEIAIPESIHNRYSLNIGSFIYLDSSQPFEIKYIFRNLYNIKNPMIDSDENVMFIGATNSKLHYDYIYAVFDNITKEYNEVYLFSKATIKFKQDALIYLSIELILVLLIQILITIMYKKAELKNLYKDLLSGDKNRYFESLFGVNSLIHLLPMLVSSAILLIFKEFLIGMSIIATALLYYIFKVMIYRIKMR